MPSHLIFPVPYILHADVNECVEGTAGCNQRCVNTHGNYTCACYHGYTLSTANRHTCLGKYLAHVYIFGILHCKKYSNVFAYILCILQTLMSAPLVMVAVNTTVTTLSAPTTATVVLGTHWTVTVAAVMVSVVV